MRADDSDERDELVASIAQSVALGTYRVPAEDVATAIMSGPFGAYLRRLVLFDASPSSETSERDDD